jgi:predicted small lipoprotein YifL
MRFPLIAAALLALAGCGADDVYAPDADVQRAVYVSDEPPSITLFTVIRKSTGEGAHSGLMINGSQRIMLDPAGSWNHPLVPERHDVFFGITPRMKAFYIDYHARETYDVVEQRVPVSPEVAELAIRRALAQGSTPKAFCSTATTAVLRDLPGFEQIPQSMFPGAAMRAFDRIPGVYKKLHHDGDPDNNSGVLLVQKKTG